MLFSSTGYPPDIQRLQRYTVNTFTCCTLQTFAYVLRQEIVTKNLYGTMLGLLYKLSLQVSCCSIAVVFELIFWFYSPWTCAQIAATWPATLRFLTWSLRYVITFLGALLHLSPCRNGTYSVLSIVASLSLSLSLPLQVVTMFLSHIGDVQPNKHELIVLI